jgi:pre-mRNA-processing factor 6
LIEQEAYVAELSEEKRTEELERVKKTLATALRQLYVRGVLLTREQWLKEAERCEAEGAPRTCEAIVSATVVMDVEEEDRFATWLGDAKAAEVRGRVGTARAVLAFALRVFPDRGDLWHRAADLEKVRGTYESLDKLLAGAVECCPRAEVL